MQDVAVFSRGYLQDYPVFVWDDGEGLLVLGYPIGTYTKITGNYYSTDMPKAVPFYFAGILTLDLLVLFGVYYFSKLEYEMQPLHKETVRLSKLLRMYVADLWNGGLPEAYPLEFEISKEAESITMDCDARLIMRAINNLVQNSITHNPSGCHIQLALSCSDETVFLTVSDDGVGVHPEKLKELTENIHCVDSSDGRLDLRHGLGLVLVRQITEVHNGTVQMENQIQKGLKTILCFSRQRG